MKAPQTHIVAACEGVSKTYRTAEGVLPVLEDVHLAVTAGEFVSLLGPSGGGKSTLLNLLAGLEPPDRGLVRVAHAPAPDDDAVGGATPAARLAGGRLAWAARRAGGRLAWAARRAGGHPAWAARLAGGHPAWAAYMQQKDLLLPWRSLWDNVLLGPELRSRAERAAHEARAAALVDEFGLRGFEKAYPAQLSGGMRQRAALIRTLLCDQPLLLLDEPFGALDALTRVKLQDLLLEVWRRYAKTIVLVTHDVEEAVLLSDRIVLLSGRPGRVTGEFTVPHPHAVRRESPETLRLKNRILKHLEADAPLR